MTAAPFPERPPADGGFGAGTVNDGPATSDDPDVINFFRIFKDSARAFIRRPFPVIPALFEKLSAAAVTLLFLFLLFNVSYFSFLDVFGETTLQSVLTADFLTLLARFFFRHIGLILLIVVLYMAVRLFLSSVFFAGMILSCLTIFQRRPQDAGKLPLSGRARIVTVFLFRLMHFFLMGSSGVLFLPSLFLLSDSGMETARITYAAVLILIALPIVILWMFFVDFNLYLGPYIVVIDGLLPIQAAARSRLMMKKHFRTYAVFYLAEKIVRLFFLAFGLAGFSWLGALTSAFLIRPFFGFLLVRFYAGCSGKEEIRAMIRDLS